MVEIAKLFGEHIRKRFDTASTMLSDLNYQGLILGSGNIHTYFQDDLHIPFRVNPHFAHWCPANGPHHFIKYIPGKKPLLVYYSPDDFWYHHERLADSFWTEYFDIVEVHSLNKIWTSLGDVSHCVFIGDETKYAIASDIKVNCDFAMARLNWHRRIKSEYEIHCIREANRKACAGHKAACDYFFNGASEYEIHMAYLQTIGITDSELPYPGIVALNKNAAILHYTKREHSKNGAVLLIDSGASHLHYASDITRTYCAKDSPKFFCDLLGHVQKLQQNLCQYVKIGTNFADLHYKCHKMIAQTLHECGIFQNFRESNYEFLIESGITKVFFPHGLGHMLGIQVHDIGGKQLDEHGYLPPKLKKHTTYQSLRYIGTLEENNVITIEPGIYFISTLLNKLREDAEKSKIINWTLIEELMPLGGIRIEDDVVATKNGPYNITREFLN